MRLRKLVRMLTSRTNVPTSNELDYVSSSIARLHTYYRFNLTLFTFNGLLQTNEWSASSSVDLTVWDAFKIGQKGCSKMYVSSGVDIMEQALAKSYRENVTLPPFIEDLDAQNLEELLQKGTLCIANIYILFNNK